MTQQTAIQQLERGQSLIAQGNDLCREALNYITGGVSTSPTSKKKIDRKKIEDEVKAHIRKSMFKQNKKALATN